MQRGRVICLCTGCVLYYALLLLFYQQSVFHYNYIYMYPQGFTPFLVLSLFFFFFFFVIIVVIIFVVIIVVIFICVVVIIFVIVVVFFFHFSITKKWVDTCLKFGRLGKSQWGVGNITIPQYPRDTARPGGFPEERRRDQMDYGQRNQPDYQREYESQV